MTVLGVVTARGGSKGIPGKNVRLLGGKPLIAYTIGAARESGVFDRLILSTDDPQIAAIGRDLGCEVPFMRPAALSGDEVIHLGVLTHAVAWMRDHAAYTPEAVMILQPTSPFRSAADIAAAVDLLAATGADSVVSVSEVPPHFHPMRTLRIDKEGLASLFGSGEPVRRRVNRRQDMPVAWALNGAIYLFRTSVLFGPEPSLYGERVVAYKMPAARSHSIDDPADWEKAERLMRGGCARA